MNKSWTVQYWATFAVSIAAMTSSAFYSWTTPVIPKIHNNETNIRLTDNQISWVVAAPSPGGIIGMVGSGYLNEQFGRRTTFLASAFPFLIGTIIIFIGTNVWIICAARFCWGIGSGLLQPVLMMYLSEIAAKEIRGSLSTLSRFMFTFGSFMVLATGSLLSYQVFNYMLFALPIIFFSACWWIPESPYYLLKEGRVDAAKKTLMKLNRYKNEKILEEKLSEMRSHVREETQRSGSIKELFTGKQYRKAIIISIGMRTTQQLSGTIPLQQYLGMILQETNSEISIATGMIIFGAFKLVTSMTASFIVDKVGRRPLLINSYIGASVLLFALGVLFYFVEVLHRSPAYLSYITLTGLIIFSIVTTLGFDTVNYVLYAEVFPLNVKPIAMTCMNVYAPIVIFISIRLYQVLKDLSGLYGVFWFFCIFAVAGAMFTYVLVPETKGKSLREIQIELQGKLYGEPDPLHVKIDNPTEDKEMTDISKIDELSRLKT